MPSERVIVVSDVHMDEWQDDLPDQYERKREVFLDFLEWVAQMGTEGKVRRFVIVGDLVDVPQKGGGDLLPTYSPVLERIQAIMAAGVRFGYCVGNHDCGLVGLNIDLRQPPVVVGYPYVVVASGDTRFVVEHGHLYDPWLWDYVRHLAAVMWTDSAGPHGPHILRLGTATPPAATATSSQTSVSGVEHLWQTRLADADDATVRTLTSGLLADLTEDYEDVTDPDQDAALLADRVRLREEIRPLLEHSAGAVAPMALRMGGADLSVEHLVQACYSGPHWRREAVKRLTRLSAAAERPFAGIIMGHTHYPDERYWTDERGDRRWYVNSGSWRHDSADLVLIDEDDIRLMKRRWTDPLPELP